MNDQQVISHYESLATLTRQMCVAAAQGEWELLQELEQQRTRQVAAMKSANLPPLPDETDRLHAAQLIKKILADDAEIRNRTEAWMEQLQRTLQSNRQEQRLNQTYGAT